MEAGAQLEESRDLSVRDDLARLGPEDPGDALQQRALPGSILADEGEGGATRHLERDVPERPELVVLHAVSPHEGRLQRLVPLVVQAILLADVLDRDGD